MTAFPNFGRTARAAFELVAVLALAQLVRAEAVDDSRARSEGIRKLVGRHLVLYTDLPSDPEVDALPAVFDQAVPQWADYFGVQKAKTANWQARAFLIRERRRFDALGLMPPGNDQFVNGISFGADLWLYDQPTAYYRRHLLLHEGTHVFMAAFLGGCGPGWYMEGTAELMATHRLDPQTGKLMLRMMPRSRADVPMLGRIKLVHDAIAADRTLGFPTVMKIDNREQLGNEAYGWCWAACKFLDSHPRYRDRFRRLHKHVLDRDFNKIVRREYAPDWSNLTTEWQAFIRTLDHGYDFVRMAIDFQPGLALDERVKTTTIAADRGWQPSGVWLEADKSYRVTASGRYQIAVEKWGGVNQAWPCEPGGVTLEYHDGRPLGMLLGAIVEGPSGAERGVTANQAQSMASSFGEPMAIGLGCTIRPAISGTLYLRVNDSPAHLDDNRGTLKVTIAEATAGTDANIDHSVSREP